MYLAHHELESDIIIIIIIIIITVININNSESPVLLQAELEDLCFAVLHPHEYTALRNELDSIWGLQQVTDLVPVQAEAQLSQAMAGIKTAAEIAAATPDTPQPRLPSPSPVPRPMLSNSSQERSQQADSAATAPATSVQSEQQQSVQSVAGDLYAHSERGMVRAAAQARINPRQQKALQSGLLRLSPSVQQRKSNGRRSTAAVLEPPEVASSSFGPSQSAPSASPSASSSASVPPSLLRSHDDSILPLSKSSDANSHQSESSTSSPRPASHSPKADSTQSSARAIPGNAQPASSSPRAAGDGPVRVIRGRAPRQALAAKKANAERQKSGSKAGPSGRATADYSFLSADQQQVRCASHLASGIITSGIWRFHHIWLHACYGVLIAC